MLLRSIVVLLLAVTVLSQTVAGSAEPEELHRIVTAYYYAIGENRLEEAMNFYHDDSPQADQTRRELVLGQSAYLQRTSTLSFDLIHDDGKRAIVLATHRHLRIAGIKFMEDRVETRYVLRRQQGVWKLWSSFSQPADSTPGAARVVR